MSGLFDPAADCAGAGLVFLTVCPGFYRINQAATGIGIDDIVWAISTTPRKCLGFLTPAEAFLTHLRCCT